MKKKYLTIRINTIFLEKYKEMCDKIGYTQSKRIRALMEKDLKKSHEGKDVLNNME